MAEPTDEYGHGRHGGRRAVPAGRSSLDGPVPDAAAALQHNSLDDDGYTRSTYGATRAAAAGDLYDAANSSHGNLADLDQQQQAPPQSREVKVTRPTGQYEKPNRSESQHLDGAIDVASLLPSNPPGAAASQRAEAKVHANDEEHDAEYRQTDYYQPSGLPPARQSSHLDLQDADH